MGRRGRRSPRAARRGRGGGDAWADNETVNVLGVLGQGTRPHPHASVDVAVPPSVPTRRQRRATHKRRTSTAVCQCEQRSSVCAGRVGPRHGRCRVQRAACPAGARRSPTTAAPSLALSAWCLLARDTTVTSRDTHNARPMPRPRLPRGPRRAMQCRGGSESVHMDSFTDSGLTARGLALALRSSGAGRGGGGVILYVTSTTLPARAGGGVRPFGSRRRGKPFRKTGTGWRLSLFGPLWLTPEMSRWADAKAVALSATWARVCRPPPPSARGATTAAGVTPRRQGEGGGPGGPGGARRGEAGVGHHAAASPRRAALQGLRGA